MGAHAGQRQFLGYSLTMLVHVSKATGVAGDFDSGCSDKLGDPLLSDIQFLCGYPSRQHT
ncbi:hypothetical protein GCM10027595_16370 [Corynebacterium nasicanis]